MKNFIPNSKCQEEELLAKHDDDSFNDLSKKFIEKLEKNYSIYEREIKVKIKDANDFLEKIKKNGSASYFRPEILNKQSPLTIIDGYFGTGKTFFLESFTKIFLVKKDYSKIFQNIIFIDAWQYVNSKNTPEELMVELFSKLKNILKEPGDIIEKVLGLYFSPDNKLMDRGFGVTETERLDEKIDIDDIVNKLNKEKKKIIVILDNIERLGTDSWKILKAIQKISQLNFFVFILPMDLKFLKNNYRNDNSEFPIEKYIDLPIFKFKQDYKGFLKTFFNNKAELTIELINDMLMCPIEGKTKSIRQVKNYFNYSGINKITNRFVLIKKIITEFWGAIDIVENYYINLEIDIDTQEFMNADEMSKLQQKLPPFYSEGDRKKYIWYNYLYPKIKNTENTEVLFN